jgi:hypothetical protein
MSDSQNEQSRRAGLDDLARRLAAYDELAASALTLCARFQARINDFRLPVDEGEDPRSADIDPDRYPAYDEMRA